MFLTCGACPGDVIVYVYVSSPMTVSDINVNGVESDLDKTTLASVRGDWKEFVPVGTVSGASARDCKSPMGIFSLFKQTKHANKELNRLLLQNIDSNSWNCYE